jgi:hypothetical protein
MTWNFQKIPIRMPPKRLLRLFGGLGASVMYTGKYLAAYCVRQGGVTTNGSSGSRALGGNTVNVSCLTKPTKGGLRTWPRN